MLKHAYEHLSEFLCRRMIKKKIFMKHSIFSYILPSIGIKMLNCYQTMYNCCTFFFLQNVTNKDFIILTLKQWVTVV